MESMPKVNGEPVVIPPNTSYAQFLNRTRVAPIVKHCTLGTDASDEALDIILAACELLPWDNLGISNHIKNHLDDRLGTPWHVVVGESFGFEITSEGGDLMFVYYGSLAIMAWKCGHVLAREIKTKLQIS